jgi:hypothetical protein
MPRGEKAEALAEYCDGHCVSDRPPRRARPARKAGLRARLSTWSVYIVRPEQPPVAKRRGERRSPSRTASRRAQE